MSNQNTVNSLIEKAIKEPFDNIGYLIEISIALGYVSENEYDKVLSLLGNSECVIQSVASDIGKDLRVYVIDKKIIASIIRISNSDFRSNFCLGGSAELYELSDDEIKIVKSIIDMFDFGFVGIDFVFNNGKMIFNEIEDVVGARMIYAKTNINVVSEYLDYILSRI